MVTENPVENGQVTNSLLSPRLKSVAAMAGWDEESLLLATLIVEDTPDREFKQKKRFDIQIKTPTSNSRRKRRAQRSSSSSVPVVFLDLDDEETTKKETDKNKAGPTAVVNEEKKKREDKKDKTSYDASCSSTNIHCLDKLRDELSCAICLEICFEPSTTSCGHSFCRKCLRSAADRCGKKCPKCREPISNGRSCTVNTVLWNTIQLLFPQEVEARKAAGALNGREVVRQIPETAFYSNTRNESTRTITSIPGRRRNVTTSGDRVSVVDPSRAQTAQNVRFMRPSRVPRRDTNAASRRSSRGVPSQDEDAALALRLQREEFMEIFRGTQHQQSSSTQHQQSSSTSLSLARARLRSMATRARDLQM